MSERTTVGEICNREVICATEDMALKDAARLMRDKHVGSLVVTRQVSSGRAVVGMLTDRDITVMAVARDFDPQTLRVSDIMSGDPITACQDDSVNAVLARMRASGVRRVPVTTDDGLLVGIVTLDDLLEVIADEMKDFAQAIQSAQKREARVRV